MQKSIYLVNQDGELRAYSARALLREVNRDRNEEWRNYTLRDLKTENGFANVCRWINGTVERVTFES